MDSKNEMSVFLVEYDENWPTLFLEEKALILSVFGKRVLEVEHIGSTAIPNMVAKPVLDIMVLIKDIQQAASMFDLFASLNYRYFPYAEDLFPKRRWFCKPSLQHRTHHLHLVESRTAYHRDHLLFRDYLRSNDDEASVYTDIKRHLASRYQDDREAYTNGKSDFINRVLRKARVEEKHAT